MYQITEMLVAVQKCSRVYNRMMTESARNSGITKPELDVLLFLFNNPKYDKASDVSEMRFLAKSYVSKTVDLLQKRGYLKVQEDTQDRRIMRLKVTEDALPLIQRGKETQKNFAEILYSGMSDQDMDQMHRIYSKMMENLDQYM